MKRILDLMDKLELKDKEINDLKSKTIFNLQKGEKLMTVIINTYENIYYAIICKNTDKFSKIEEIFYEKYPKYKESENIFVLNNTKINRYKTLDENKIQYSDLITLVTIKLNRI